MTKSKKKKERKGKKKKRKTYTCMFILKDFQPQINKHMSFFFSFFLLLSVFSSSGPVNYCHHLASVVCKLFTFQASSLKPLGQLEPNLARMFLRWSSTKFLFFVPVGYSTWLPGPMICSDWLKFQRSSSLKLMN